MATNILQPDRYIDVLRVLDPSLDPDALPDDLVGSDMYAGQASRMVLRGLPGVATHVDEEGVQRALVYYTASLLAEALPKIKQSNMDDHAMTMDRETPQQAKYRLLGLAREAMADLAAIDTTTSDRPTLVTTVPGRRA